MSGTKITELYKNALNSYNEHKYEESLNLINQVLKQDPNFQDAQARKGQILYALGKYGDSIESLNKSLEIDNFNSWNWRFKALSLWKLGELPEAIRCFDQALKIDPDYYNALIEKGNIMFEIKNLDEASKLYELAMKKNQDLPYAWHNIALVYKIEKQNEQALKSFRTALEKHNNVDDNYSKAETLYELGKLYMVSGEINNTKTFLEKAIVTCNELLKHDENNYEITLLLGDCLREIGNYNSAESSYNKILERSPDDFEVLLRLVYLYAEFMIDRQKSMKINLRMVNLNKDSIVTKIDLLEDYVCLDQYENAINLGKELLTQVIKPKFECIIRLYVLFSNLLRINSLDYEMIEQFIEYYKNLDPAQVIDNNVWHFTGFLNTISKKGINDDLLFIIRELINLISGKLDDKEETTLLYHKIMEYKV